MLAARVPQHDTGTGTFVRVRKVSNGYTKYLRVQKVPVRVRKVPRSTYVRYVQYFVCTQKIEENIAAVTT